MSKDCKEIFSDKGEVLVIRKELVRILGNINDAIIFNQIHYWITANEKANKNFRDGKYWVFNTYKSWKENDFDFWSEDTISRSLKRLIGKGIVICANYNRLLIDKTKWYTIDYEAFQEIYDEYMKENEDRQQSAKCGYETADCGYDNAKCGSDSARCGMDTAKSGYNDAICGNETADCNNGNRKMQVALPETTQKTKEKNNSIDYSKDSHKEGFASREPEHKSDDDEMSETQYRNLEKEISQNLKLVFRFRNIPEDYFSVCDANPEEELNEILKYFFRKYNSFSGDEKIFTISYEETMQVVKEYFITEGILFEDSVFRFSDYKEMIDLYFTKHIKNDMEHNLSNFMNETFRKFLYEEIKEKRKDATGTSYYTAPPSGNGDDAPLPFS